MTTRRVGWIVGLTFAAGLAWAAWLVGVPPLAIAIGLSLGLLGGVAILGRRRTREMPRPVDDPT